MSLKEFSFILQSSKGNNAVEGAALKKCLDYSEDLCSVVRSLCSWGAYVQYMTFCGKLAILMRLQHQNHLLSFRNIHAYMCRITSDH